MAEAAFLFAEAAFVFAEAAILFAEASILFAEAAILFDEAAFSIVGWLDPAIYMFIVKTNDLRADNFLLRKTILSKLDLWP